MKSRLSPPKIFMLDSDGCDTIWFPTLRAAKEYFKREADPVSEGDDDYGYEGTVYEWEMGQDKQDAIPHDVTFERLKKDVRNGDK